MVSCRRDGPTILVVIIQHLTVTFGRVCILSTVIFIIGFIRCPIIAIVAIIEVTDMEREYFKQFRPILTPARY